MQGHTSPSNRITTTKKRKRDALAIQEKGVILSANPLVSLDRRWLIVGGIAIAFICGLPSALAALPGAHSATTGGEVFLGGNYIEIGIHSVGSFGTSADKPAGFYGTSGSAKIGLSSDNDGFGSGYDLRIDYFLPGTPEERWVVGYNGNVTASNAGLRGVSGIPITSALVNTSAGNTLSAELTGTLNNALRIRQQISFRMNDKYFANRVTLTNISGSAITSVRYMRSFDPDNTVFKGGSYTTRNEVTKTIADDGQAVVVAKTTAAVSLAGEPAAWYPVLFFTKYAGAVASTFGFANDNPYAASAYSSPAAKNTPIDGDQAITLDVDVGTLAPGASASFTYYTSLDSRDPNDIISEIEAVASKPTVTTTATALQYQADGGADVIDSALEIEDTGYTSLQSATVTLSNFQPSEDVLSFTPQEGITTLSSSGNLLSFTGSALISTYRALLRSVTYKNTNDFPNVTSRTATFSVTNPAGGTGSATRSITVIAMNHRPVVANAIPNQSTTVGTAFSYTIPDTTFSDPDSDTLTVTTSGLPSSLSYSSVTRTMSGTTTAADIGAHTITVTARDDSGEANDSVSTTFTLTVSNPTTPAPAAEPAGESPRSGGGSHGSRQRGGTTESLVDITNRAVVINHLKQEVEVSQNTEPTHASAPPPPVRPMEIRVCARVKEWMTNKEGSAVQRLNDRLQRRYGFSCR
jgi:hypothetical protein